MANALLDASLALAALPARFADEDHLEERLPAPSHCPTFSGATSKLGFFVSMKEIGYFHLSSRYTLGSHPNREMTTPAALSRHEDHIVEALLGYLRPPLRL